MFEWEDGYKLGLPEVDAEHLVLFSLINQIEINMNGDKADECLDDVLGALMSYVSFHFTCEEALMEAHDYPRLAAHVREHRAFMAKVQDLRNSAETGLARAVRIRAFVLDWLVNHILRTDVDYAQHILGA